MATFLTGSRAYGVPREDSDIDLAVLVTHDTFSTLLRERDPGRSSVRFGRLNLILFENPTAFERWRRVTLSLEARAPVSRDEAIAAFAEAGFLGYGFHDPRGEV